MNALRALAPQSGAYVSESNYFEADFQHSYWVRIGSEQWSRNGFTKL